MVDNAIVPVPAAQADVALDADGLEAALHQPHQRDVKGPAAEVVDQDGTLALGGTRGRAAAARLEGIGEGSCGWLVEDVEDFQARDAAGVLGRLAARVVEVGGDGDD